MTIITKENFDIAYDILECSFIPAELKEYKVLKAQWEKGEVIIEGIEFENKLAGVITLWVFKEFVFAENFAIKKELRNKGLGATLLQDVINKYKEKMIILEVEPAESQTQARRIGFYERNGFTLSPFCYIQPPLRKGCEDVSLQIMHTGDKLTDHEFNSIKEIVFKTVYNCLSHKR